MRTKVEILNGRNKVDFFLRCHSDFKFFCEDMLGQASDGRDIKMKPYQMKWVAMAETYERLVIEAAAGFAKSETMGAMYPLWLMFRQRNLRILLVSKTRDQSKGNLLARMKNYISENEFLKELFVPKDADTSWNQNEIITKQGHWVRVVPYNTNIRGYRAHIIICDEADDYDDPNIYFEHVVSRVFEGGKIILISTPTNATKLIGQLKEKANAGKLKNYHFEKTRGLSNPDGSPPYTCKPEDVTKELLSKCVSIWPEGYSKQTLLDKWDEQGRWFFMRNVMCFSGNTLVQASDGLKRIDEISIGDSVLTHKGRFREVKNKFIRNSTIDIEITQYGSNEPIKTTNEHPFLVVEKKRKQDKNRKWYNQFSEPKFIEANKIVKNKHYLLMPKLTELKETDNHITSDLCNIIGWYLAEGSLGSNNYSVNFDLNHNEIEHHNSIKEKLENISNNKVVITSTRTTTRIRVCDKKVHQFLLENFGKVKNKHLPQWVFGLRTELLKEIYTGYFDGDGCIRNKDIMETSSVVRNLSNGISLLLPLINKIPYKRTYERKAEQYGNIEGRNVNFSKNIHIVSTPVNNRHCFDIGDYLAYGIRKINAVSIKEKVYNIEVEEDNSYCLNSCAVHNCEVLGEADDAIFKINDVMEAYDYTLGFVDEVDEDAQYFIGADFAISSGPRADFDAFTVVKKKNDQYTVVQAEDHKGWQRPVKVQRLKEMYEKYDNMKGCIIVADESNMGTMVMNDLRALGCTVVAQNFHSAARKKLILTLANVFQGKAIIIPRSVDDQEAYRLSELVKDQLVGFRRRPSEKTGAEAIQSTAPHDDMAISLAMAVQEGTLHEDMELKPVW